MSPRGPIAIILTKCGEGCHPLHRGEALLRGPPLGPPLDKDEMADPGAFSISAGVMGVVRRLSG